MELGSGAVNAISLCSGGAPNERMNSECSLAPLALLGGPLRCANRVFRLATNGFQFVPAARSIFADTKKHGRSPN